VVGQEATVTEQKGRIGARPRAECSFFAPPPEIEAIRRGCYSEYVGLFVNDGRARWIGFDADERVAVRVERWAGPMLRHSPAAPGPGVVRRRLGPDGPIDLVSRRALTPDQVAELTRLAEEVWAASAALPRPMTDTHRALVMLDGDVAKLVGGPGALPSGPAEELETLLGAM
jgi:hypothetical protein